MVLDHSCVVRLLSYQVDRECTDSWDGVLGDEEHLNLLSVQYVRECGGPRRCFRFVWTEAYVRYAVGFACRQQDGHLFRTG